MRHRARIVAALAFTLALAGLLRPAAAAVTVTYGVVSWNPFHWVVMVGTAKGQFEKHGVEHRQPGDQKIDDLRGKVLGGTPWRDFAIRT